MNKGKLKSYAPAARRAFIQAVTDRAHYWGLSEAGSDPIEEKGDVALIGGRPFPRRVAGQVKALSEHIKREGFSHVMEEVAYTWFNRFMALRYMEIHGYLDHGFRVLSSPNGSPLPEILEQAARVELPGLRRDRVIELKLDGSKDAELYRLLLVAQCNALHEAMPFLFERIDDATELLLPDNLLHSDSLIRTLVTAIDEEDWQEVEIIGWLYQFYISEKKDQVIGKVVKSEDIPAATQLFTPNWIVKYMVQNTLGRKWLATYPNSPLRQKMEYYIEPAEQTEEVNAQLKAIIPDSLDPELLTFLDPAMGSGHILVEAYDVFKEIYLERGYSSRDFPRLILEKNLYGLDIDDRAAQMAGFALLMKARKDDRRILRSDDPVKMNVMAICETGEKVQGTEVREIGSITPGDIKQLLDLFKHAKTFGSLITISEELAEKVGMMAEKVAETQSDDDLFTRETARSLQPLIKQATILASKYDCVVANPPYMGSRYYGSVLKRFVSNTYEMAKGDLYTCFMARNFQFANIGALVGMITIPNWMFLSTFEALRTLFFHEAAIETFCHNGRGVFGSDFGSCVFTYRRQPLDDYKGSYRRLFEKQGSVTSNEDLSAGFRYAPLFNASTSDFRKIPGCPLAYWINQKVRDIFAESSALGEMTDARQGLATGDNDRFIRLWYEVSLSRIGFGMTNREEAKASERKWFPFNKGGEFRKWYGNLEFVINWEDDGRDLYAFRPTSVIRNPDYYFREAVTWSDVTIAENAFRYVPKGLINDSTGHSVFNAGERRNLLLSFCNNAFASKLIKVLNPTVHFHIGYFNKLPFPARLEEHDLSFINDLIGISKVDWDSFETSWDFQYFPWLVLPLKTSTVADSWQNWESHCTSQIKRMQELETENNRLFIDAYGLQDELTPEVPEDQITLARADREADVKRLISYAIGCMMGRYSLDEPGLICANSGNVGFDPSRYPTFPADDDGIVPITDMEWFPDDVADRFEEFLNVAWSADTLEENLRFVAESLSPRNGEQPRDTVRRYISTQFFKDHLQTYKRRPIYWLFSSGKQKAFECLVYLHRYHEATLSRMRNEYVTPLHGRLSARSEWLKSEADAAATTSARNKLQKELETIKKKQTELAAFDDLLRHYADQRISIDLDDGVKVNYGKFGNLLAEVKAVTGE